MASDCCHYIRNKMANRRFEGYESEKKIVRESMLQTIHFCVSTSVFIFGPSGVGKTLMVNSLLDEIEDDDSIEGQYLVIKLNGILQHTDDLAIKSIVRALNYEGTTEEEYRGTAAEYLAYVIKSLRQADGSNKSLIVIIDEFHVFCNEDNQLLYNLLDVVNRKSAAVCIIGITASDICLTKINERTQSRLALTNVYLYPKVTMEDRLNLIRTLFTIEGRKLPPKTREKWNKKVEEICSDNEMKDVIGDLLSRNSKEETFKLFLNQTLLYIDDENYLDIKAFKAAYADFNSRVRSLNLATLDLCLLIAIYHICKDHDRNSFNFDIIYSYYIKVAQKSGKLPQVDSILAMKAFQNLRRLNYIRLKPKKSNDDLNSLKRSDDLDSTPVEFHVHELVWNKDKIKEYVRNLSGVPAELRMWMDNSLFTR